MQLNDNDKVQFVIPQDGGDALERQLRDPEGRGPHRRAPTSCIDYYYDVAGATLISEYIGYFTGVNGVQEQIVADAEAARADGDTETADYYDAWRRRSCRPRTSSRTRTPTRS